MNGLSDGGVTILEMSKDLRRLVTSLRELIRLFCWTEVSFGAWSLGGPQRRLLVCVGGLDGRAGKFSFLGVGNLMVALGAGVRKV